MFYPVKHASQNAFGPKKTIAFSYLILFDIHALNSCLNSPCLLYPDLTIQNFV